MNIHMCMYRSPPLSHCLYLFLCRSLPLSCLVGRCLTLSRSHSLSRSLFHHTPHPLYTCFYLLALPGSTWARHMKHQSRKYGQNWNHMASSLLLRQRQGVGVAEGESGCAGFSVECVVCSAQGQVFRGESWGFRVQGRGCGVWASWLRVESVRLKV